MLLSDQPPPPLLPCEGLLLSSPNMPICQIISRCHRPFGGKGGGSSLGLGVYLSDLSVCLISLGLLVLSISALSLFGVLSNCSLHLCVHCLCVWVSLHPSFPSVCSLALWVSLHSLSLCLGFSQFTLSPSIHSLSLCLGFFPSTLSTCLYTGFVFGFLSN